MTLPELIQWGWDNDVKEKAFYSNLDGGSVYFDKVQNVSIEHETAINESYTVEVEEEITEDTVIPVLVRTVKRENKPPLIQTFYNMSIRDFVSIVRTLSWHMLNEDNTMILLWKDGAMVE